MFKKNTWFGKKSNILKFYFTSCILVVLLSCMHIVPSYALRDPTEPQYVDQVDTNEDEFELSFIFMHETRPFAIINGRIVKIGERIGNARVLGIKSNEVKLLQEGKIFSISLFTPMIQKHDTPRILQYVKAKKSSKEMT